MKKAQDLKVGMVMLFPYWGKTVPGKVLEVRGPTKSGHMSIVYLTDEDGVKGQNMIVPAMGYTFKASRSKKFAK